MAVLWPAYPRARCNILLYAKRPTDPQPSKWGTACSLGLSSRAEPDPGTLSDEAGQSQSASKARKWSLRHRFGLPYSRLRGGLAGLAGLGSSRFVNGNTLPSFSSRVPERGTGYPHDGGVWDDQDCHGSSVQASPTEVSVQDQGQQRTPTPKALKLLIWP